MNTIEIEQELKKGTGLSVRFVPEEIKDENIKAAAPFYKGTFLNTELLSLDGEPTLLVGLGSQPLDKFKVKEVAAKAVSEGCKRDFKEFSMDITPFFQDRGVESVRDLTEGALLGDYRLPAFGEKQEEADKNTECRIRFGGIPTEYHKEAQTLCLEASCVAEGVRFARDMVNMPGNRLRPEDFAKAVTDRMAGLNVEAECFHQEDLREMGMHALLAVGDSSEFSPCLLVLRYKGMPKSSRITGLVGKSVTCDTGGYCLKASASMTGIKGDMAGGAAVAGAVFALAKSGVETNVTAILPMCENRISAGSLLPGDVISSYSGKTIEVLNTDAEGRLILADAVSYAVRNEKVTELLDIATLTGAVAGLLGFTIGGVLCDTDSWYREFEQAFTVSGERYLRIPFYEEHEKLIESKLADVKNVTKECGTIGAGLFIRAFAEGTPWLHLDIAGTAWVESPIFAFQSAGATGAGVSTLYQLCRRV